MTDDGAVPEFDPASFPSLKRIGLLGRRIPFVAQTQTADCGAACLAMVLGYFGHHAELASVREVAGIGRDGASAASVLDAAEHYGLRGRGLRVDLGDLKYLSPASILHWNFNHFVVFERMDPNGVVIVDPGGGRRFVPMKHFRQSFTGVVLTFEPTSRFVRSERKHRSLSRYFAHVKKAGRSLQRVLFASVVLRLLALALPLLVGLVVDRVVPRGDHDFLLLVSSGIVVLLVFQFLFGLVRSHLMLELRTGLDTELTVGFLDHLVSLPYAFFQHRSSGDLMMRVNSNGAIRDTLTTSLLSALLDGLLAVAYLAIIALISPVMAALVVALAAAQVVVFLGCRLKYRDLMAEELESRAAAQGYLVQIMTGIETLKLAGSERRAVEHWSNLFVDELNVSLRRGRLAAIVEGLMHVLDAGAPLAVLCLGAVQVIAGHISIGGMLALNALAVGFLTPLGALVQSCLQLQLMSSIVERIDDVFHTEPEQASSGRRTLPELRGEIELSEVSFAYDGRADRVVRDVSLRIPAGTSLAIVGSSGSGKSTLAKLIAGIYLPTEGQIRYDGYDIRELDRAALRRQLGVAPQNPYLFGGPLRRNIALADPGLSRREVVAAAKLAAVHEEILRMPMGYETLLDDGGTVLSGGQRQRIALARALARRPPVLILDEATSALDARTEERVMKNLSGVSGTRIIIAHRLSTIVNADRIVVMDDGRICESGTHAELIRRSGVYASLVSAQVRLEAAG